MSDLDERYGPGTRSRLADIAALCQRAELLAARGVDWYEGDPELSVPKLATDSLVLKLGGAVRRLPEAFLTGHRADPVWRQAIGVRDRLGHHHDAIDYPLVWQVVSVHAGQLRRRVEELLER